LKQYRKEVFEELGVPVERAMKVLKLHEEDTVAVVLGDVKAGDTVEVYFEEKQIDKVVSLARVPRFHKIAISDLPKSSVTRKYGEVIGVALCDIARGEHVHVHNIESVRGSVKKNNQS
jgi:altronate dehydratase